LGENALMMSKARREPDWFELERQNNHYSYNWGLQKSITKHTTRRTLM